MGTIRGICISKVRGIQKTEIEKATLVEGWGIENDAHAGQWHRQVSLLGIEQIEDFRKRDAQVDFGAFGENIIVEGYDLKSLPIGTRFQTGEAILELTQIGKECHTHCQIHQQVGDCIMPREGVFTRVVRGGEISVGDEIHIIYEPEKKAAG